MRFNFRTLCRNAAERGGQMQRRLLDALGARHTVKSLPEFGIERAAQLAGCTANHLRRLESRGDLPEPRLVEAGSIQRRVYNYNEINRIRESIGKRPGRPAGAGCVRAITDGAASVGRGASVSPISISSTIRSVSTGNSSGTR